MVIAFDCITWCFQILRDSFFCSGFENRLFQKQSNDKKKKMFENLSRRLYFSWLVKIEVHPDKKKSPKKLLAAHSGKYGSLI